MPGVVAQLAVAARGGRTTLIARVDRRSSRKGAKERGLPESLLYSVNTDNGTVKEVARCRKECYNPAPLSNHQEMPAFWKLF